MRIANSAALKQLPSNFKPLKPQQSTSINQLVARKLQNGNRAPFEMKNDALAQLHRTKKWCLAKILHKSKNNEKY